MDAVRQLTSIHISAGMVKNPLILSFLQIIPLYINALSWRSMFDIGQRFPAKPHALKIKSLFLKNLARSLNHTLCLLYPYD
jgi:hypothetical protein